MSGGAKRMDKNALILLVQENPAGGEYLRQALDSAEGGFRVQPVDRVATALARIAGGGVALVILDLPPSPKPEIERLDSFLTLRGKAPQVPVVVIYDSEADSPVLRAVRAGAAGCLPRSRCDTDLGPMVRSALGRRLAQHEPRSHLASGSPTAGALTTFLGAKGGVGATTVALNVASALAESGKVILAEPRPMFGTLAPHFHLRHLAGNITHLLRADPGTLGPAEIEACLWTYRNIPGLKILFGPQTIEQCGEVAAHSAKAILTAASMLADYVVVDLPASLSDANRAIIQGSDALLLVVERDPVCIESGKRVLEAIHSWNALPPLIGSVIVNRAPLADPMDLSEIERRLGIPTLGVIPPAPDLCIAAQKAGTPLALFDPDSMASQSMTQLAEVLATPGRKLARAS